MARQLHDRLLQLGGGRVRPFLDVVSLRPGDRLAARIDEGIGQCRVAVAIFSAPKNIFLFYFENLIKSLNIVKQIKNKTSTLYLL